jgi:micrococcal nuclease
VLIFAFNVPHIPFQFNLWQYHPGMEESRAPQTHHRRRRRTRVTLAGAVLVILSVLLTQKPAPAATNSGPSAQRATATPTDEPNTVKQALENAQPGMWTVVRDVDGDTINVQQGSIKETVRFLGVDTPETHDPRKPVQCFGQAAAAHTKSLLEGKNVRLEADPTDSDRDKYHRLLRYVYLPDGTLVNAELIRDGWGFAYTIFPIVKLDEFRALETKAREENRGLWAGCKVNSSTAIEQTSGSK